MISRTAGVIATTALTAANALLIPPGVSSLDGPIGLATVNTNWQTVKLPCSECVFSDPRKPIQSSEEGDDTFTIQGGANSLLVNITTLFGGNAVGLEQHPLYPPLRSFTKPTVHLIPSEGSSEQSERKKAEVHVTFADELITEETVTPEGDAVIHIKWQIRTIDNQPVTVDAIEITALKAADKSVSIMNVEAVPKAHSIFDSLPPHNKDASKDKHPRPKPQCHLPPVICKFKEAFEDKVNELKAGLPGQFAGLRPHHGCAGKKWKGKDGSVHLPTHIRPHPHMRPEHEVEGHHPEGHRPEGHRPDGHHSEGHRGRPSRPGRPHHRPHFFDHHHHHHHHSVLHSFLRGFLFFLIPMVLGVSMGMVVSVIGMLIGRLIAFVWIRFVRGGKRGYASVRLNEDEADEEEGKGDVESVISEDLPRYEEAPAYSEKETL